MTIRSTPEAKPFQRTWQSIVSAKRTKHGNLTALVGFLVGYISDTTWLCEYQAVDNGSRTRRARRGIRLEKERWEEW